ncbi:MAG: hypothetical protein WBD24_05135 [Candidatus Omnitrophota bacterium]
MKNIIKISLSILVCFCLAGCATTPSKYGYSGADLNAEHFKKFDDQQMLVLFDRIYNEPVKTRPDETAKDITVTALMIALESRSCQSDVIMDSGVLGKPHKRIELNKWTDDDLVDEYNAIIDEWDKIKADAKRADEKNINKVMDNAGRAYWSFKKMPKAKKEEISSADDKTTLEIIQLTALFAINNELGRRDNIKRTWEAVGSATMAGVGLAAKVAIMLAKFLI